MNFHTYLEHFKEVIEDPNPAAPYDNPDYLNYTNLNWSRLNRWLKRGEINENLQEIIKKIDKPQSWIIITDLWCGDAAHIVPFFQLMAKLNPLINADYELRDAPPFRINHYLTNGKSKSIPILIVKDKSGNDLFHWGPRPKDAQELYLSLHAREADFEESKVALQQWYNKDKGQLLQKELAEKLSEVI